MHRKQHRHLLQLAAEKALERELAPALHALAKQMDAWRDVTLSTQALHHALQEYTHETLVKTQQFYHRTDNTDLVERAIEKELLHPEEVSFTS